MNKLERFVRQEDNYFAQTFNCCFKKYFQKKIDWGNKVTRIWKDGEYLNHFKFADDILIFIKSSKELKNKLTI